MQFPRCRSVAILGLFLLHSTAWGQVAAPTGTVSGAAFVHTATSHIEVVANANLALPASATAGSVYFGKWRDAPRTTARVPVVVFLHGSSGLGLKAIEEWQRWLAEQGIASVAPDSFALPDRLTYTSPVGKDVYERIHELRASEIGLALAALKSVPWADTGRMVLAGTSEGAVPVARYGGIDFAGRVIFAWSCENNYFVHEHRTAALPERPVLNVISLADPYFSPANAWLGNAAAKGHCGDAFRQNKSATVVLIAGAPHTALMLPAAKAAVAGFLRDVLK